MLLICLAALIVPVASYAVGWVETFLAVVPPNGFGSDSFSAHSAIAAMMVGSPAFILYFYLRPRAGGE